MKLCFILFCQLLHGGYCSKIIYIFFVKQLLLRQLMYISVLLQSFSKSESPKRFQQLKSNKDFVNGIFQSLPNQYTHEVSGDWKGGKGQCHFPCILHFYSRADNHKIIFFSSWQIQFIKVYSSCTIKGGKLENCLFFSLFLCWFGIICLPQQEEIIRCSTIIYMRVWIHLFNKWFMIVTLLLDQVHVFIPWTIRSWEFFSLVKGPLCTCYLLEVTSIWFLPTASPLNQTMRLQEYKKSSLTKETLDC